MARPSTAGGMTGRLALRDGVFIKEKRDWWHRFRPQRTLKVITEAAADYGLLRDDDMTFWSLHASAELVILRAIELS